MNVDDFPRKQMAAGAVVRDDAGRIVIVKPTYRPDWLVPGGMVELDESPRLGCAREVAEELGLTLAVGRLLCVDYRPAEPPKRESVQFIFDAGTLDAAQIARIHLPPDEIAEYRLLPVDDAIPLLNVHLARRMVFALRALSDGGTYYLEDGREP